MYVVEMTDCLQPVRRTWSLCNPQTYTIVYPDSKKKKKKNKKKKKTQVYFKYIYCFP